MLNLNLHKIIKEEDGKMNPGRRKKKLYKNFKESLKKVFIYNHLLNLDEDGNIDELKSWNSQRIS